MAHWQPKDRKEDIAQDIRDFVQHDDPGADMASLRTMRTADLTALMLATRNADRQAAAARAMLAALQETERQMRRTGYYQYNAADLGPSRTLESVRAAIAQAEAAGIKAQD